MLLYSKSKGRVFLVLLYIDCSCSDGFSIGNLSICKQRTRELNKNIRFNITFLKKLNGTSSRLSFKNHLNRSRSFEVIGERA